jgi:hypothetical protein
VPQRALSRQSASSRRWWPVCHDSVPRLAGRPGAAISATNSTPQPNAGAYPNPLVQRAIFGWLPKGYATRSVIENHENGQHTFEVMAGLNGGRGGVVDVTDFGGV